MAKPTPRTGVIRARVDPELKAQAETILNTLGLNASQAIRLFYRQITLSDGLPFLVKIPNVETRRAIEELEAGRGTRHDSPEDLFGKLGC